MVGPIARREVVGWLQTRGTSLRRACRVVGLSTATWRYQRQTSAANRAVLARLQAHAAVRARFGYRRLHILLEREGLVVNHKRVHRIYRAAGLQVRRRHRKRLTRAERIPLPVPDQRLARWSMDFTRECVAIEVDRSLPGLRVARVLDRLHATIGLPPSIVVDNGPEFAGRTLDAWAYARGVTLRFIRPGKPVENAYIESFNGKFRDECLNEHWFVSLTDAQLTIEAWRIDYNTVRPHSSLDGATPEHFAKTTEGARRLTPARPDKTLKPEDLSLSV